MAWAATCLCGLVALILYAANTMLRCLQRRTVLYMLSALNAFVCIMASAFAGDGAASLPRRPRHQPRNDPADTRAQCGPGPKPAAVERGAAAAAEH